MATQAIRVTTLTLTGDVAATLVYTAATNAASAAEIQMEASLVSGANTITVPTAVGFVPTSVIIQPPSGNIVTITLKGVTGDTGIALHLTDHTVLALPTSVTSFVLTVGAAGIVGLRLIWS